MKAGLCLQSQSALKPRWLWLQRQWPFIYIPQLPTWRWRGGGKVRGSLKPCTSQGHGQERWHGPGSSILWLFAGESGGVGISRWLPGTTNGWQWMQKKWMQKCRRNEKKRAIGFIWGFSWEATRVDTAGCPSSPLFHLPFPLFSLIAL